MNTNNAAELLIEIARDIKSNVSDAKGFVLEQAPDFIQQLLVYNFWASAFSAIVLLFVTAFLIKASIFAYDQFKKRDRHWSSMEEVWIVVVAFSVLFSGVTLGCACSEISTCLQIKLAPKVYIVEYASKLIK